MRVILPILAVCVIAFWGERVAAQTQQTDVICFCAVFYNTEPCKTRCGGTQPGTGGGTGVPYTLRQVDPFLFPSTLDLGDKPPSAVELPQPLDEIFRHLGIGRQASNDGWSAMTQIDLPDTMTASELEVFRQTLERLRGGVLEEVRTDLDAAYTTGKIDRDTYEAGLEQYRTGIELYKDGFGLYRERLYGS